MDVFWTCACRFLLIELIKVYKARMCMYGRKKNRKQDIIIQTRIIISFMAKFIAETRNRLTPIINNFLSHPRRLNTSGK